ncbi:lumenal Hsp70 protein [Kickxella alabastrina]|uniref:Lumenal Hsp70 protein n=1 Tax=Kickxella alabastrina TaxID=61397 RepID=A0ACC1IFN2_9FUNG|nr:lumenal Hsp70 protein [Kickxella alabastrina]
MASQAKRRGGGQRKTATWRAVVLVILGLLACMSPCADAAVLGIDFGTEWFTVALANPGRPLDLVLNRDANRQTPSVVTVIGLERTFGSNAVAIAPRLPVNTFMAVRNLLGVQYDSEVAAAYRQQFPNKMIKDPATGVVAFEYGTATNETLTVQEIVAMQLRYAQQLVKENEGLLVKDAVFTVPSFFDRTQRQAMLDAATLAGFRTMALVNDGSAVALNYAMSGTFSKPETHLFYDMGAGKTVATVASISARSPSKHSKANKATVINVHAFASDKTLGGQEVDFIMRDLLVDKFAASNSGLASDLRGNARAMNRLLKEAKRVKTILSVNTEAVASVEGLHNGIDFRIAVSRVDLEKATAHLLPRVRAPIDSALRAANMTIGDIDSILLVGGGTRAPFVHKEIALAFGAEKISRNINAEEACVMGAVFKGATLSSHFRVRDMRLRDAMEHAVRATYSTEAKSLLGSPKQETVYLIPEFGAVGARRMIRDFRSSDLAIKFEAKTSGTSEQWNELALANIGGVSGASAKLKSKNIVSDKPEVKVVTQTNELGFFEVVKAEASFNVTNPGYSQYIEDLAAWEKESAAADAEAKAESESESETQTQTNGEGAKQKSKSKSLRSRPTPHPEIITEVVQLDINVEYRDLAKLGDEAMKKSRSLLKRMDDDDKARFAHHDAINQLETLIYHLRDIVEDEDVVTVTTNDEREALSEAVSQAAEWLESSAESSGVGLIELKVKALKEIEKPIVHRRTQAAKRPDHISSLRAIVAQAEGLVAIYRREYTADEIAPAADVLRELEDTLDSTTSWLDEMTSKQDALAAHADPVLTTADMDSKAVAIELSLAKVVAKKIRKAKAQSTTAAADINSDNDKGASEILEDDSDYIDEDSEHTAANNNGHDEL